MKFYPLLDVTRPETLTKENLQGMRTLNMLPVTAYASLAHFAETGGQGLPAEGQGPKFWRDNGALVIPSPQQKLELPAADPEPEV